MEAKKQNRFKIQKLEERIAPVGDNWTSQKQNGGGNTPKGEANGVPTVNTNPGGNQPPGQN
jgi:hypothetical protein